MEDGLSSSERLAALFRAASGAAAWGDALAPVADALDAHHHSLWLRSDHDMSAVAPIACTMPAEFFADYRRHYGGIDPLAPRGAARPRGTVFTSDDLVPFHELRHTEYWADCMGHHGMRRFIGAALTLPGERAFLAVAFQRPLGSEPFEARDRELMAAFLPQLQAAVEVWSRLRDLDERASDLESLLDAVDSAMVLLDASGRARTYNRGFASILARCDGLLLDAEGHLQGGRAGRPLELLAMVRRVAADRLAATLTIARPSGAPPYRVVATPFDGRGRHEGDARVVVRVEDPDRQDRRLRDRLCDGFQLTAAEAEVVLQLARGLSLQQIAATTGRSIATARNLVKRAFAKTGTHRQAELVSLVHAIGREVEP